MNTTFLGLELRRVIRDYVAMFFIAVLPAFFYLIFGAAQPYSSERAGNGNVAMYIMISMAAYGAVTATTGVGGMAAVERMQGWGRQLGLTPLPDAAYVAMKALVALAISAVPVGLIYLLGVSTGAEGTALAWVMSGLLVLVGAAVFSVYGLAVGLAFRTEASVSAASGLLVIMAFLGNIFIPLSGTLLTIAKFTPLYGYVALARYPLTEGYNAEYEHEPLWLAVANVAVWAAIFGLVATALVRRGRGAPMTDGPERIADIAPGVEVPSDPWARFGWVMGVIWLVFLGFPLAAAVTADRPWWWRMLAVVVIVAFGALYVHALVRRDPASSSGWRGWGWRYVAASVALAFAAAALIGDDALGLAPYVVALSMFVLPFAGSLAVFGVTVLVAAGIPLLRGEPELLCSSRPRPDSARVARPPPHRALPSG